MKKLIIFFAISLFSLSIFGQIERDKEDFGERNEQNENRDKKTISAADSARLKVKPLIKFWKWEHEGVYKKIYERDTSISGFHMFNPIFKKSISNTYTGNLSSPSISNIFIDREKISNYLFLNVYHSLLNLPLDQKIMNTTTPFTSLTYKTAGSRGRSETGLNVLHSQNINPFLNVKINFNLLNDEGQYIHSKCKTYDFSFSISYEKDRIANYFFVNQNMGSFEENGGVEDPKFIRDTTMNAENVPVKLMYPESSFYNFNLYTHNSYNIGKKDTIYNKKDTLLYYPLKVTYTFRAEENRRKFIENTSAGDYFANNYIDKNKTNEQSFYQNIHNSLKLIWNEKFGSLKPGAFVGIYSETEKYKNIKQITLVSDVVSKYSTQYIEGGIFKQDSGFINFDFNIKQAFIGHYKKDMTANALIDFNIGSHTFEFVGKYNRKAPDYFMNYYFSNHYKWDNNFNAQKDIKLAFKYINKKYFTELGLVFNNINNYQYFNNEGIASQHNGDIKIATAYLKKVVNLGNFHLNNSIYYQKSNNDILALPKLSYYLNYFYQKDIFKKALKLQVGADLWYNSKFYAPSYNVATSTFYNQDKEKFGNYYKLDVFANLRIKRAIIFIKYEHLSFYWGNKNYFSNAYNAINPPMLKYGVRWCFYD